MKLSKTQEKVLNELKETIRIFNKYNSFEDFFINSNREQGQLTTASSCNNLYNTPEKYKNRNLQEWKELEKAFYECRDNHRLLAYAKTETLKKLETLGFIKILEVHCSFEYVEVL